MCLLGICLFIYFAYHSLQHDILHFFFKYDCQEKFVFPQLPYGSSLWPASRFRVCLVGET